MQSDNSGSVPADLKLDILAIGVHPDDIELGCGGTLAAHIAAGKKVGILDLTAGELGTRGTPGERIKEAEESARILGLAVRENAGMADGFFTNDEAHQKKIAFFLRKYRPDIVLANAIRDRHPDHGRAAQLINDGCFYSGLRMVRTEDGKRGAQSPWRPRNIFHFIQDRYIEPDFVVDITPFWENKKAAVLAYQSQFFIPEREESKQGPQSYISSPEFMEFIEARAEEMGHSIGVKYGEGFTTYRRLGITDLSVFC